MCIRVLHHQKMLRITIKDNILYNKLWEIIVVESLKQWKQAYFISLIFCFK